MTETIPTGAATLADAKTAEALVTAFGRMVEEHSMCPPEPSQPPLQQDPIHHRMIFSEEDKGRQTRKNLSCKDFPRSDLGNSQRFVTRFGQDFKYCHPFKSWFHFDGCRWARDERQSAVEYAKEAVIRIADEAALKDFGTEQEQAFKWAGASQASSKITGMLSLAQSSLAIETDQFDPDPNLLNFPNGTLNLKNLSVRPAAGLIISPRYVAAITTRQQRRRYGMHSYKGSWGRTGPDRLPAACRRVQSFRYTGERALFACHGRGANGKSTFLNALLGIMGDYGHTVDPDTYCVKHSESVRNDIATLKGVRFAVSTEARKGKRLDERVIKQLTGGEDKVRARFLFQEEFEYQPELKIWWAFNNAPRITDSTTVSGIASS